LCDAHHVEPWADGGATSLANTCLLWRRHHRAVHEEGFSMEMAPNGEARFYRPDGRPLPQAPTLPTLPALAREPVTAPVAQLASHGWPWTPAQHCPSGGVGRSTMPGRSIGSGGAITRRGHPPPGDGTSNCRKPGRPAPFSSLRVSNWIAGTPPNVARGSGEPSGTPFNGTNGRPVHHCRLPAGRGTRDAITARRRAPARKHRETQAASALRGAARRAVRR
jgi:hypothetical protein